MERKYSVSELDALRRAVENKYLWGRYSGPPQAATRIGDAAALGDTTITWSSSQVSRCYREEEKAAVVEEQVRTHMLAGHTAEDLQESEQG